MNDQDSGQWIRESLGAIATDVKDITEKVVQLRIAVATLKTQAGIIAFLASAVTAAAVGLLFKKFGG